MEGGSAALHEMLAGEPDVGNPQVRFDEGEQWTGTCAIHCSLLYWNDYLAGSLSLPAVK
jgi:hypothetical protein